MAASVQFRPHNRDLGMVMREVDEDLAIFLGIRNHEKQTNDDHLLLEHSDEFDDSIGEELETFKAKPNDHFLQSEIETSNFDWLLTQADTSLLPSLEVENVQDFDTTRKENLSGEGIFLDSELEYEKSARATNINSSATVSKNSSSSRDKKRATTPNKPLSLPTKPNAKPSRTSTPISRTIIPSSKLRSSTPIKMTPRPAGKPAIPITSKSEPRSIAPKTKNPIPSRGVLSKPSKPLETFSMSHNLVQNPKTLLPKRPVSASRGRPATNLLKGKPRQRSCSPERTRASNTTKKGGLMLLRSRGNGNDGDDVNPVLMGTQMVERVVNMRKLAPPMQDQCLSNDNPKKSSKVSGFGRSLSSRSLDMAVRHMDITRSIANNIRYVKTSALSGTTTPKSSVVFASESPIESSSDCSESSISVNSRSLDGLES